MHYRKVYVDVVLAVSRTGEIRPRQIRYEDGTLYHVDRIVSVLQRSYNENVGGFGTKYTAIVRGQQCHLFHEKDSGKWFVEAVVE